MAMNNTIVRSVLALSLAVIPATAGITGFAAPAFAKGGEGNGGGGGNGGGNGGGGNHGGDNGKSSSGKSTSGKAEERGRSSREAPRGKASSAKASKASVDKTRAVSPGLRSLNRNYRAYLNTSDPRMTAVAAYALAYAQFEAEYGVDAVPTDPQLSDEALREALAGFSKSGVVTDATLDEAKSILGVGTEVGKIDQIRESLPSDDTDLE
ncbi:hypothetical protein [Rhizobium sp. GR12]|uniref:hypothetical protein n=1 Tax=Rhizobium TaxID=379 RepID=UPI002FBE0F0F